MLVHGTFTASNKFASSQRGNRRIKCFAYEQKTMSPARTQIQSNLTIRLLHLLHQRIKHSFLKVNGSKSECLPFIFYVFTGVLNLTHLCGHSPKDVQPLKPDEIFQAQVKFDSTAYTVATGHKIRLALSSVHWPYVWPSPHTSCLLIETGSKSKLRLPVRASNEEVSGRDAKLKEFDWPEYKYASLPVEIRRNPEKKR